MSEVTRVLSAIEQGDPHAAEQLLPLVYDELRKLAAQKMAQEAPNSPGGGRLAVAQFSETSPPPEAKDATTAPLRQPERLPFA
jgi:hypothetical protein